MFVSRLFSDAVGESHFDEIEIKFNPVAYAPPAPPVNLSDGTSTVQLRFMEAPSGWSSDWHTSLQRSIFFVFTGEWEVTASDGESRRFGVGSALLVEDLHGKGHRSQVVSDVDSVAVMIELGTED